MKVKRVNIKLVSVAILPALAASIAVILVSKAAGFPDSVGERIAQIVFFPLFLGASHAWRSRFEPAG